MPPVALRWLGQHGELLLPLGAVLQDTLRGEPRPRPARYLVVVDRIGGRRMAMNTLGLCTDHRGRSTFGEYVLIFFVYFHR